MEIWDYLFIMVYSVERSYFWRIIETNFVKHLLCAKIILMI